MVKAIGEGIWLRRKIPSGWRLHQAAGVQLAGVKSNNRGDTILILRQVRLLTEMMVLRRWILLVVMSARMTTVVMVVMSSGKMMTTVVMVVMSSGKMMRRGRVMLSARRTLFKWLPMLGMRIF